MSLAKTAAVANFSRFQITDDGLIAALWTAGFDTRGITDALDNVDYPESRVANRLAALRDARAL